jgi:hypothetical protein
VCRASLTRGERCLSNGFDSAPLKQIEETETLLTSGSGYRDNITWLVMLSIRNADLAIAGLDFGLNWELGPCRKDVTLFCVGVKTGYRHWSELMPIKNTVISILDTLPKFLAT